MHLTSVLLLLGNLAFWDNTAQGQPPVLNAGAARSALRAADPAVRLRAALALVQLRDLDGVPVLIDLLRELGPLERRQAEDALQELAGEWAPNPALSGDDEVSRNIRRDAWAAWWKHTDGPALLAAFRSQCLTPEAQVRVRTLIDQLGDNSFKLREQAVAELVTVGPRAVPALREAARGGDLEKVRRAETCLARIAQAQAHFPQAAPRLLALRRPPGAVAALLDFLPFAESEAMIDEVSLALKAITEQEGRAEPELMRALADVDPLRRGVAAEALARASLTEVLPEVRKLLADRELLVRLRAAVALVRGGDRQAVPALIQLVGELPARQSWPAQDLLFQLAGENLPQLSAGEGPQAQFQQRDAWAEWWRKHGESIDLAKQSVEPPPLGYTLLVQIEPNNNRGRVVELGRDGKPRWQIDNLQFPVDAQVLGGTRVLVAEYNGRRVTERDLKGQILWQKDNLPGSVTNAQRLRNGNTFIATENTLLEVNPAGTSVFSHQVGGGITAAYKLPNGEIICLLQQGRCLRLDSRGKELKSFPSGRGGGWTSGLDLLPNGRILISQPDRNLVSEFDLEGKQLWQANAPSITTATRLSNGHTLVASYDGRRVYELDRAGKQVWEHRDNHATFRARRR